MLTRLDTTFPTLPDSAASRTKAIVIGAGFGGLAAAMRLGAKGYQVTVVDRLKTPGGRATAYHEGGHRFDLGPTIVTLPQVFEELWAATGRNFRDDVDLRPLDPFYTIRFADGAHFTVRPDKAAMTAEVMRLSPGDLEGYRRFVEDGRRRYSFGFENMGGRPMTRL